MPILIMFEFAIAQYAAEEVHSITASKSKIFAC
jgi:hypothetical protein